MSSEQPWWASDPMIAAARNRAMAEIEGAAPRSFEPDEPDEPDGPDPVLADVLSGASLRELAGARDDLGRAKRRYEEAIRAARLAGNSWGTIGRVLGVPRQVLHRRFGDAS